MNDPFIESQLGETKSFRNVDPVILASGEVGFVYINTEKLMMDGGKFKDYKENSWEMYNHTIDMYDKDPKFAKVIDIVSEKVSSLRENLHFISGGQTRDWVFSCPVAKKLNLPHISIYKNGDMEVINSEGKLRGIESYLNKGYNSIHIVDLLTEASSCYRSDKGVIKGWIPFLRNKGFEINNLITIVDRMQKGVERLNEQGVEVISCVQINKEFLEKNSNNVKRDVEYFENPKKAVESYFLEKGIQEIVTQFDPKLNQTERVRFFLNKYSDFLADNDLLYILDSEVNKRYGFNLGDFLIA